MLKIVKSSEFERLTAEKDDLSHKHGLLQTENEQLKQEVQRLQDESNNLAMDMSEIMMAISSLKEGDFSIQIREDLSSELACLLAQHAISFRNLQRDSR